MNSGRLAHWQGVYKEKGENQVSWFQETPTISLELIRAVNPKFDSGIVDIGGRASRLVDALAGQSYRDLTVLDVSDNAISVAKLRLGERAATVKWIVTDVTQWEPTRRYDLWYDRAAFHFLTEAADRGAYVERLTWAACPWSAMMASYCPRLLGTLSRSSKRADRIIGPRWAAFSVFN